MKIVFLGTPDFALPSLEALFASPHEIAAVVTNPDRRGDKLKLMPPPVKRFAKDKGLRVLQYANIRNEGVDEIAKIAPDLMVTAAFGQILSEELLALPRLGVLNVHGSLLPKYRGASPIQQAILNGDKVTGVTIMRTAYQVDSGDILLQKSIGIKENETGGELFERLAVLGAAALIEAIGLIERDEAIYTPQNHGEATFCRMLTKESGLLDFSKGTEELRNFVRALNPWPAAYTYIDGKMFKIWRIAKLDDSIGERVGMVLCANAKDGIAVQTGDGRARLDEVQLAGGRRMSGAEFAAGHRELLGKVLGA